MHVGKSSGNLVQFDKWKLVNSLFSHLGILVNRYKLSIQCVALCVIMRNVMTV